MRRPLFLVLAAGFSCAAPAAPRDDGGMLLVPQDAAGTPADQPGAIWLGAPPTSSNYLAAVTDDRVVLARGGEALLSFDQAGVVYVRGHRAKDDHEIADAVRQWAKALSRPAAGEAVIIRQVKPSCDASCAGREL